MKKMLIGLLAAFLLTMTACAVNVDAGTVADKRMEEAYSEEVEIMETEEECEWDTDTKMVNGKSKTTREYECETVEVGTGEYETVDHPARYFVTLEDKDGNDEEHEVDEETYNSLDKGDFYDTEAK